MDKDKDRFHRLSHDPLLLNGFSKTLPEIEWLLLVLVLFYQIVENIEPAVQFKLISASCVYTVIVLLFRFVNFLNEPKEWKIAIHIVGMILYISYVIWCSDKLDTPLFNLYLLPIIASSITLGKVATFLETLLICASIIYLQDIVISDENLISFAGSSKLLMQISPLLLVAYITTMLFSDIQRGFNKLKVISETDELTQLFNHRTFNQLAIDQFYLAKRHKLNVSILMIDVDDLKPINDKYGHEAGNLLLTNIAKCIASVLREEDVAARYGGDEFVALLSGCNEAKAQQIGQRIIEKFKKEPLLFQGINIGLSASIGIATYPSHGKTPEEVLHNADGAMYTSKEQGNNLITLYQ